MPHTHQLNLLNMMWGFLSNSLHKRGASLKLPPAPLIIPGSSNRTNHRFTLLSDFLLARAGSHHSRPAMGHLSWLSGNAMLKHVSPHQYISGSSGGLCGDFVCVLVRKYIEDKRKLTFFGLKEFILSYVASI